MGSASRCEHREGQAGPEDRARGHTTCDQTRWGAPPPAQVIAHTNLYWMHQTAPGRIAGAIATDTVKFESEV